MNIKYEAVIGSYSFIMTKDDVIEVWSENDSDNPESYIFLKRGEVNNEKDFQTEVSFWYINSQG